MAEDSGLIVPLGRWVIEEAIRAASERDRAGHVLDLALNLSPVQFHQSDIAGTILGVLEREQFPAERLIVELTEAALPPDIDWVTRQLRELRDAGVRTAIDDFGAGHASLNYLCSLPLDILKLDRQFIADLPSGRTSAAIVEGAITIAHRLGLKVIAEGVETAEQRQFLEAVGCDFAQGFLFSPALPRDELSRFLEASTVRAAA